MTAPQSGAPLRPARPGRDVAATMRRRQKAGQINRIMGWALLPILLAAQLAFHMASIEAVPRTVDIILQSLLIAFTFVHAGLSFYVFGAVRPQRTLRVFHIYFGYLTFVLVMISQSTISFWPTFHRVTSVLMYLAILTHTVIGVRYQLIRSRAQRNAPESIPINTR